jgi:hypothetical protein
VSALNLFLTVYPIAMPPVCSCALQQGIEDPTRAASFVRTYNVCVGNIVGRFAVENEQYRAKRWPSVFDPRAMDEMKP